MDKFRKFMYGRYGGDLLSKDLLILSFILLLLLNFLPRNLRWLEIIAYIPIIICMFRIFSKSIYKRQQENYKYLQFRNPAIIFFKQKINKIKSLKSYKYFTCPKCKQQLRVPRKQGKISITCPKCKNSFKGKS